MQAQAAHSEFTGHASRPIQFGTERICPPQSADGVCPAGSWQRKRRDGQEGTKERMQGMMGELSPAGLCRDNMCSELCREPAVA